MDDFRNVIKKDPQVLIKRKDMLDKYNRLHCDYQSKKGYNTLIQNDILQENNNLLGTTIVDIDTEKTMEISRIKSSESKLLWLLTVDE